MDPVLIFISKPGAEHVNHVRHRVPVFRELFASWILMSFPCFSPPVPTFCVSCKQRTRSLTHARTHKHSLMYTLMHTYTHALVHTNLQICARDVLWHELFSYTGCIGTLNWIFCCTLPFFILSLVFSLNTLCNRLILFLMLVFKICTDVSYADGII